MPTEFDRCRKCGEQIEWGRWDKSGKSMPLDAYPHPAGKLVLVNGKISRFTDNDAKLQRDRRVSHFDTCKA